MKLNDVIEFAKKQGYDDAKFLSRWKGYDVYEPIFDGEDDLYVGLPYVILVKGDEIRLSTPKEAFDFIDSQ